MISSIKELTKWVKWLIFIVLFSSCITAYFIPVLIKLTDIHERKMEQVTVDALKESKKLIDAQARLNNSFHQALGLAVDTGKSGLLKSKTTKTTE